MANINYFKILQKRWKTALIILISTVILSLLLSLLQPIQYSSTIRLLVIQRSSYNQDPYTAIKASESIGDNLSQVIYTSTFFDKVMDSGFNIDSAIFPKEENKKRKEWGKMVDAQVSRGTGMLRITVYHKNSEQATQIANAIAYVLTIEGWEYIGGDLRIKLVDAPLQSRFPVKPDFLLNGTMGLVFGLLLGILYVFVQEGAFDFGGRGRGRRETEEEKI